jgi:hypothetical protein
VDPFIRARHAVPLCSGFVPEIAMQFHGRFTHIPRVTEDPKCNRISSRPIDNGKISWRYTIFAGEESWQNNIGDFSGIHPMPLRSGARLGDR